MNYGFFDNKAREYVITDPQLPSPWINYLGNGGFGGIISATAGGLTFDCDPSNRRITRYKYQNMPIDRPGRYLYIRDEDTGDYFSPMWQPVQKNMQLYECRHGLGYTKISGMYADIKAETTYFVPIEKPYEIWQTKLTNKSERIRKLKLYSYVEFSYPVAQEDILLQWTSLIPRQTFKNGRICIDNGMSHYNREFFCYIGTSLPVIGFDCDPLRFVGAYRSESNPIALDEGNCFNSLAESNNCIGVLCSEITLQPHQEIDFVHTLGAAKTDEEIDLQIKDAISEPEKELEKIELKWSGILNTLKVNTPCDEMNQMLNCWHPYQTKTTFDWSRFISIYERGVDRGFGFRDSMQDVLGVIQNSPEQVKERIKLLLSIQKSTGDALSVYFPATKHAAGGGRSDDHLWSILSVCNYIKETGDNDFINETVSFHDGGEATVAEHLERGLDFTMTHIGAHGLPDFLMCDWDDSLGKINVGEGTAESTFVFFQLAHAAYELIELYKYLKLNDRIPKIQSVYDYCKEKLDIIWDGKWFIRAFTRDGKKFCTDEDEYNKIHLIPQAWSVLSRLPDKEKANSAMDNVMKYLYTEKGFITHYNPSDRGQGEKSYFHFPAGAKENGGIFFHSNTWVVIAYALLGRGDDAFKSYFTTLPNRRNDIADICLTEPYVYSQAMMAPPHKRAWACTNSWLTGTASWMYYAATQYILGIRPEYEGLAIDPQIPSDWEGFTAERICRDTKCNITVTNPKGKLYVNGNELPTNIIPWDLFNKTTLNIELK